MEGIKQSVLLPKGKTQTREKDRGLIKLWNRIPREVLDYVIPEWGVKGSIQLQNWLIDVSATEKGQSPRC